MIARAPQGPFLRLARRRTRSCAAHGERRRAKSLHSASRKRALVCELMRALVPAPVLALVRVRTLPRTVNSTRAAKHERQ